MECFNQYDISDPIVPLGKEGWLPRSVTFAITYRILVIKLFDTKTKFTSQNKSE